MNDDAGGDIVSSMLMDLRIQGVQIEDKVPLLLS